MSFTINDFVHTCDIDAMNKKIDALHKQTEANDAVMAFIINDFPTVDEVNEALKKVKTERDWKYVLKSSLPYMNG